MNKVLLFLLTIVVFNSQAQVASVVYPYDKPMAETNGKYKTKTFFVGETRDFKPMSLKAFELPKSMKMNIKENLMESLIIIKEGKLEVSINGQTNILGPGSIALLMPGDKLGLKSQGAASYYLMQYQAKNKSELPRGTGSFIKDWDKLEYKTHDKGGIRNFYNQTTAECIKMEMHVTNLNSGIKSHEPHTHRAAELIIMIKGKSEMELGDSIFRGQTGDIFYLGSDVPHGIKNIDTEQIQYFAFQFE
ncbi:(S)-ureidoglycine aminohydrolase [Spirosomataceae bacterium TFI 002]|nr:(S)-ureidoglycine aminohydrolase [Spirosomataceae bacterium TFI 002]